MPRATLFRNGRSQAERPPKEFRFQGDEVSIRRKGKRVILEPVKRRSWPKGYWTSWAKVPDDFQVHNTGEFTRVSDLAVEDWV